MSLTGALKSSIRRILAAAGWRIHTVSIERSAPRDLRETVDHPGALLYYGASTAASVLTQLPVQRGYTLEAFELDSGAHPFVRAIRHAEQSKHPETAIREVLDAYYRTVRPDSAAQWLGLDDESIPPLADQPPWARILPWDNDDLRHRIRGVRQKARQENQRFGAALSIQKGWKACGPVTDAFLDIQTTRLHSVYRSIKTHGLRRHDDIDGDIRALVLVDGEDWTWLQCGGGFHRCAVGTALGFRTLPVRIWRVVFRRQVDIWPQVAQGLYSRRVALAVFDRIISGRSPPVATNWWGRFQKRHESRNKSCD